MKENKEINLLPCPFCGGEASVVRTREESYGYWQAAYAVGCSPCNILLGHFEQAEFILGKGYVDSYKKGLKTASEIWNTRYMGEGCES